MAEVIMENERGRVYFGRAGDTLAARGIGAARSHAVLVELKAAE